MQSYQGLATVRAVETVGRGKSTPAGFVFGSSTFPYQPPLHHCSSQSAAARFRPEQPAQSHPPPGSSMSTKLILLSSGTRRHLVCKDTALSPKRVFFYYVPLRCPHW